MSCWLGRVLEKELVAGPWRGGTVELFRDKAAVALAAVDAEKLSEDVHKVDRELHALQVSIAGVETAKNEILSTFRVVRRRQYNHARFK